MPGHTGANFLEAFNKAQKASNAAASTGAQAVSTISAANQRLTDKANNLQGQNTPLYNQLGEAIAARNEVAKTPEILRRLLGIVDPTQTTTFYDQQIAAAQTQIKANDLKLNDAVTQNQLRTQSAKTSVTVANQVAANARANLAALENINRTDASIAASGASTAASEARTSSINLQVKQQQLLAKMKAKKVNELDAIINSEASSEADRVAAITAKTELEQRLSASNKFDEVGQLRDAQNALAAGKPIPSTVSPRIKAQAEAADAALKSAEAASRTSIAEADAKLQKQTTVNLINTLPISRIDELLIESLKTPDALLINYPLGGKDNKSIQLPITALVAKRNELKNASDAVSGIAFMNQNLAKSAEFGVTSATESALSLTRANGEPAFVTATSPDGTPVNVPNIPAQLLTKFKFMNTTVKDVLASDLNPESKQKLINTATSNFEAAVKSEKTALAKVYAKLNSPSAKVQAEILAGSPITSISSNVLTNVAVNLVGIGNTNMTSANYNNIFNDTTLDFPAFLRASTGFNPDAPLAGRLNIDKSATFGEYLSKSIKLADGTATTRRAFAQALAAQTDMQHGFLLQIKSVYGAFKDKLAKATDPAEADAFKAEMLKFNNLLEFDTAGNPVSLSNKFQTKDGFDNKLFIRALIPVGLERALFNSTMPFMAKFYDSGFAAARTPADLAFYRVFLGSPAIMQKSVAHTLQQIEALVDPIVTEVNAQAVVDLANATANQKGK